MEIDGYWLVIEAVWMCRYEICTIKKQKLNVGIYKKIEKVHLSSKLHFLFQNHIQSISRIKQLCLPTKGSCFDV